MNPLILLSTFGDVIIFSYQNGPDTYLLQLRDVDFPCRLREYMKVAHSRGPGRGLVISDDGGFDWRVCTIIYCITVNVCNFELLQMPIIRERRRFTDVMDEEIDDERKERINQYGAAESYTVKRLKRELGL